MTNIYQEIHNEQAQQVEQLEADYTRYLKAYNEIKGNKTLRYISRTGLRGVAITCYILFVLVGISIALNYTTWLDLIINVSNSVTKDSSVYRDFIIVLQWLLVIFWPAIAFVICGLLLAMIRRRNKVTHSLSELLQDVLSHTGASIQKAKESQKDFERFASEILKKQMQENQNKIN